MLVAFCFKGRMGLGIDEAGVFWGYFIRRRGGMDSGPSTGCSRDSVKFNRLGLDPTLRLKNTSNLFQRTAVGAVAGGERNGRFRALRWGKRLFVQTPLTDRAFPDLRDRIAAVRNIEAAGDLNRLHDEVAMLVKQGRRCRLAGATVQ